MSSTRKPRPRPSWLLLHKGQFTFLFPEEKVSGSWAEVRCCDACSADPHQVFKSGCGSEAADLRLNSFGSQHFAWTFLAPDSNRPKDSRQIPDADWKHAAPTVCRSFPNKTKRSIIWINFKFGPSAPKALWDPGLHYVSARTTQKATSGC